MKREKEIVKVSIEGLSHNLRKTIKIRCDFGDWCICCKRFRFSEKNVSRLRCICSAGYRFALIN